MINNKENNDNNIINEIPKVEEKKNKVMDRINKGRKKAQDKKNEEEKVNNYKKSEKIQNFANELEKVMFGPKEN